MSELREFAMPEVLVGPQESAEATAVYVDWSGLVARIRAGETDGMAELYQLFSTGIRFYLARRLGPGPMEDKVHETFVAVVQAIRRDELKEPQRLMGFVEAIVLEQVEHHIERAVRTKKAERRAVSNELRRENPEEIVAFHQRMELIHQVLATLSPRDREIVTRFYLREQTQEEICQQMGLSETQFRLLKSRANARFLELGKKLLSPREQSNSPRHEIDPARRPDAGETEARPSPSLDVERILPVVAHAIAVLETKGKRRIGWRLPCRSSAIVRPRSC
jgi:RNA polymerase sigma-70 factor (ECF subfamily)